MRLILVAWFYAVQRRLSPQITNQPKDWLREMSFLRMYLMTF